MSEPTCQHGVSEWCVYCELEARQAEVEHLEARATAAEQEREKQNAQWLEANGRAARRLETINELQAELDAAVEERDQLRLVRARSCSCICHEDGAEMAAKLAAAERREAEIRAALVAAEQFIHPEITRGPGVNGWANTLAMVQAALASPSTPSPAPSAELGRAVDKLLDRAEQALEILEDDPRPSTFLIRGGLRSTISYVREVRSEAGAQPEAGEPKESK